MTEHKNRSEQYHSATRVSGVKFGFMPQPIRHGLVENTINGIKSPVQQVGDA
jgi:hypothetical protein